MQPHVTTPRFNYLTLWHGAAELHDHMCTETHVTMTRYYVRRGSNAGNSTTHNA